MQPPFSPAKINILVAPLDWGMGHAARCIPIVNQLLTKDCQVWLAGEGDTLQLLREEFPQLPVIPLRGYRVFYQKATGNLPLKMTTQLPAIAKAIRYERKWLKRIVKDYSINIVISDNRFGLHNSNAYTIFITHQLHIRSGMAWWIDRFLQVINYRRIRRFNACWIPDYPGDENLAGALSHPDRLPPNTVYIGALSRFEKKEADKKYDLLIVLSGPEPARTDFENKLRQQLQQFSGTVLLVRGTTLPAPPIEQPHISVVNLMTSGALNDAMNAAEWVICRSGYTSVMDLMKLQKKAILIPTPGQPEQEYLADSLFKRKIFYSINENELELTGALQKAAAFPYRFETPDTEAYKAQIDALLAGFR
ncbi:MAG: glycosyl transferase family 28 [Chitinophagaceae bacterium]|nr:glycosyl transferase family 28 [Chitinophagaceae bacterium]MCW5929477.1 glycosyl transferase family 28 [Chitinophagaceae bacterium]